MKRMHAKVEVVGLLMKNNYAMLQWSNILRRKAARLPNNCLNRSWIDEK